MKIVPVFGYGQRHTDKHIKSNKNNRKTLTWFDVELIKS